jgi:hypothetical protein
MSLYLLELDDELKDYDSYHRILVRAGTQAEARGVAARFVISASASFGIDEYVGGEVEHDALKERANFSYEDMYGYSEACYNPWLDESMSTCVEVAASGDTEVIIFDYLHG